jgi:hypothetical protein
LKGEAIVAVLTAEDLEFFDEYGYVVVRSAVPQYLLQPVIDVVWQFLEMDPNEPESWYSDEPRVGSLVHIHQHQALWDTRQYPRVHQAFAEIFGTERLWVSMDRAGMKPPRNPKHPAHDYPGFIHWDIEPRLALPFGVQGVLYLNDTGIDEGGFQCVPGFHKDLDTWIAAQPADLNLHYPDLDRLPPGLKVEQIPGHAGDLVIWNQYLAHGNAVNLSQTPRLAQYIRMAPAQDDEAERLERIACWQERRPPKMWEGDERQREQKYGVTAELTPLGRKLLGLDPWK